MLSVNVTNARENLYQLITEVNQNSAPVKITNARGQNVIMIAEDDWNAIEETLFLNSIPGMVESIISGGNTPVGECLSQEEVGL